MEGLQPVTNVTHPVPPYPNLIALITHAYAAALICYHNHSFCQAVKIGSPAHPSYPAGHAVQNGAYATLFKVKSPCYTSLV